MYLDIHVDVKVQFLCAAESKDGSGSGSAPASDDEASKSSQPEKPKESEPKEDSRAEEAADDFDDEDEAGNFDVPVVFLALFNGLYFMISLYHVNKGLAVYFFHIFTCM